MTTHGPRRPRPYRPDDLPALLAAVGEWNARTDGCGYLHPGDIVHYMSNALRGRDLDEHFSLYESDDGRLLALLAPYPTRHVGFDLLIHPDARGGEVEAALLAEGERAVAALLHAAGAEEASLGSEAMDCDAPRREALARLGYVTSGEPSTLYTTRSLRAPIPESILPDGFTIRSVAGEHEVEAVCAVHDGAFTPKWTRGEYLAVMRTPGFEIERELVVVAPDGRFAAFLVYWVDPVSRSGLFEPVGCHREFQRRGLAKALMYEGMRRMAAHGMETAIVKHIADNPPAVALYHSAGFRTKYTISDYRKSLR